MNTPGNHAWLRLVVLTILAWFGPSVLVLQRVHSWTEFSALVWVLPVFPGVVAWHMGGALFGRLHEDSLVLGALFTVGFVVGTFVLAHRCQHRSSEWLPLLAAFIVACLLWWEASQFLFQARVTSGG